MVPRVSWAAAVVLVLFAALDATLVLPQLPTGARLSAVGYVLLGAWVPAAVCLMVEALARLAMQRVRKPMPGVVLAALAAAAPSFWLAAALTAGRGISASTWGTPLFVAIGLSLSSTAALAAFWGPRVLAGDLPTRAAAVIVLVTAGAGALGVSTFQPLEYMVPHRGIVLLSALLLQGAAVVTSRRTSAAVIGVVLALGATGVAVSKANEAQRAFVLHQVFEHAIVGQKVVPLLVWVTPPRRPPAGAADPELLSRPLVPAPSERTFKGYNFLLLTADTLRADRVDPRGRGAAVTKTIGALQSSALVFRAATSNYSQTDAAIPVYMSGDWDSPEFDDGAGETRLPRLFRQGGYQTISTVVKRSHFRHIRGFDLDERYDGNCLRGAQALVRQLDGRDQGRPFFAWFHSFDLHDPATFEPEDELFGADVPGHYDAAAHLFDRCVARVRDELQARGLWDKTVLIISADHGEALGEHGRMALHQACYPADFAIPMVFRLPGLERTIPIDYRFQLVDFLPTLAGFAGLDTAGEVMRGRDFSGLVEHPPPSGRGWALAEGEHCAALLVEDWHLVYQEQGPFFELYATEDFAAAHNLASEHPEVVNRLSPTLLGHRQRFRH